MSRESNGLASRMFDACIGVLLAALALWGAVQIIKSIWLALCIGVLVVLVIGTAAWYFIARARRY